MVSKTSSYSLIAFIGHSNLNGASVMSAVCVIVYGDDAATAAAIAVRSVCRFFLCVPVTVNNIDDSQLIRDYHTRSKHSGGYCNFFLHF